MTDISVDYNIVIDAIVQKIISIYGEDEEVPPIYKEKDNDEAETPMFFVWALNTPESEQRTIRNKVFERTQSMQIRFFPPEESNEKYEICLDMANKLDCVLREISVGGVIVRGSNINHEINENVLQFYVTYKYRALYPIEQSPKMGKLRVTYGLRNRSKEG